MGNCSPRMGVESCIEEVAAQLQRRGMDNPGQGSLPEPLLATAVWGTETSSIKEMELWPEGECTDTISTRDRGTADITGYFCLNRVQHQVVGGWGGGGRATHCTNYKGEGRWIARQQVAGRCKHSGHSLKEGP